jgi:hypothetical protein
LLITGCQGGSLGVEILNLWGAATLTGGRLPSKHELISQLDHAGFQEVQTIRLIPGEALFAFKALPGKTPDSRRNQNLGLAESDSLDRFSERRIGIKCRPGRPMYVDSQKT